MVHREFRNQKLPAAIDASMIVPHEEISPVPGDAVAVHSADRFQEPYNLGEKKVTSQRDIGIDQGFGPVGCDQPCRPAPIDGSQILKSDVEYIYGSAGHDLFPLLLLFPLCLDIDQGLYEIDYFDHYTLLVGNDRVYLLISTRRFVQGGFICC